MPHECEPPDWDEYAKTIKKMGVSLAKDDREKQVKVAFESDESMPDLLRRELADHDGKKRPALRSINKRLREADHYDHDTHGEVSTATFYEWCKKYEIDR